VEHSNSARHKRGNLADKDSVLAKKNFWGGLEAKNGLSVVWAEMARGCGLNGKGGQPPIKL